MHRIVSIFDTGAGENLMRANVLERSLLSEFRQTEMPEIGSACDTKLVMFGIITLYFCMCKSRTEVIFEVVDKLAVLVILEPTFIDRFTKSIHLSETMIELHCPPPVDIQMVHEATSSAEKNTSDIC